MKIDITEQNAADTNATAVQDEQSMIEEAIARGTQAAEAALEEEQAAKEQHEADAVDDLLDRIDELEAQLAERIAQVDEAHARATEATDKYVRLYASWENFRKRTEVERKAERTRATQGLVSHLIVVLDDIDRALEHGKEHEENPEFAGFLAGFEAVRAKFMDALAKEHVAEIDPVGQPFDALMHQAVATVANEDEYDETVSAVFQKGYRMGDYVLRPAMVQITQGGPSRPIPEPEAACDGAEVSGEVSNGAQEDTSKVNDADVVEDCSADESGATEAVSKEETSTPVRSCTGSRVE